MVPFADATDNRVEQSAFPLVELYAANGDLMFSTNRCTNFFFPRGPVITVNGSRLTFTGNQLRTPNDGPTVSITFIEALSAVGNIIPGKPRIIPSGTGAEVPAPFEAFNRIL